jgi:hypothetical protein
MQHPEELSKVASVQKKVRVGGRALAWGGPPAGLPSGLPPPRAARCPQAPGR